MDSAGEILAVVASVAASALAAVKMVLAAQGKLNDRFAQVLESHLGRQEATIESFRRSIEMLANAVRETGVIVAKASERVVTFEDHAGP